MIRKTFMGILVSGLLILGLAEMASAQGRGQGFRPCPYTPYACPVTGACVPGTITGKVKQVLTESLGEGMHPGMAVLVESQEQGEVHVHLGPVWFLERQEFELAPGDEVSIQGQCQKSKGKFKMVASILTKGDSSLFLRDSQGTPYWEAWRKR